MAIIKVTSLGSGAASVPDATTVVVGKVRLATILEATTGTSEAIAVTPAGLAAGLGSVVGGLTYKGLWDAINAVPDLSNAEQGDFYKVSGAGTRYGQDWQVGDMLVINADMGGAIDPLKIDKIDNTESISVLSDLADVNAGSPSSGDVLQWSGAAWVNHALVAADVSGVVSTSALDAEASTRASADTTLQSNIDAEAGTRASADTTLQGNINAEASTRASADSALQSELNTTQAGAGLSTSGAYTAPVGSNYLGSAISLKDADSRLDTQLKVATDKGTSLQSELDATQVGAGLGTSGAYTAPTSSNYLGAATSLKDADSLLDSALKAVSDQVDLLGGSTVTSVNMVTPVAGDVTLTAQDVDTSHTATSYTAAGASVTEHLAGVDSALGLRAAQSELDATQAGAGLNTSGAYVAPSGSNYTDSATSLKNADSLLDTALKGEETARMSADSALQSELDATQAGAGLSTGGAYTAPTSSNYLGTATSLKDADSLLDAKLKETRDIVDALGAADVTSVNGVAPVAGDVTLGGADIDTAHTATNYTAAAADLDSHLAGVDSALGLRALSSALATVATSGAYSDLTGSPVLATVATSGAYADLTGSPVLATVATSGLYSDLTGSPVLATVATSGAYADLTGSPVLATVATSGLYSDLTGSPVLATVATSGAAGDVSVSATPNNYTAASADVEAHLAGVDSVLGTLGGSTVASVNTVTPVGGDVTITAQDVDTSHSASNYTAAGASVTEHLAGVDSALGDKVASVNTVTPVSGDVTITAQDVDTDHTATSYTAAGASVTEHLAGVDSALGLRALSADLATVATSGLYSDLTGTPTLATVATSGAYSDLSGKPVLATVATSGAAGDVSVSATPTNYIATSADVEAHLAGVDSVLGTLGGSTVASVNGISPVGGNVTVTATDITGFATVATSGAYSDLSGKPTLATVATSGLYSDLSGKPTLATVATSGAYSDLTGTPTLGTSAAEDVGTAVGDVVQLVDVGAGVAGLPAIDGSNLSGLDYANMTNVPKTFVNGLSFVTDANALTLVAGTQYIISTASATTKVLTVPTSSASVADGDLIRVTNWGLGRLKLTTGGGNTCYLLSGQDVVGGTTAGELYIESKCTVDLVGFNYVAGGLQPAWGAYFISSIEVNTRSFTTTGQAVIYNNTTKKLESGSADSFALSYSPTNYTSADALIGSHLAGVDTELGLKANSADLAAVATSGAGADVSVAHTASDYTAASADVEGHFAGVDAALALKAVLADGLSQFEVDLVTTAPTDGQTLLWSTAQSKFLPADPPAPVASTTQRGLIEIATDAEATAATATDKALVPSNLGAIPTAALDNSAGTLLEAANNLSDLADAPTARTNLGLGTAATANTGTSAGNVVLLEDVGGTVKLPAVDGSQLLNVVATDAVYESKSANFTASVGYHYSVSTTSANVTATLPALSGLVNGKAIRFKLYDATNDLILTPAGSDTIDGLSSYTLTNPKQSITLVKGANDWEIF